MWGDTAEESLKNKETGPPRCLAAFTQQTGGGQVPAHTGASCLFKKKRKVPYSQTARYTVHLLFLFFLKLGVLTGRKPEQTERLAQVLAPETGTPAWMKRLMPGAGLCPAWSGALSTAVSAEGSIKKFSELHGWGLGWRGRILH